MARPASCAVACLGTAGHGALQLSWDKPFLHAFSYTLQSGKPVLSGLEVAGQGENGDTERPLRLKSDTQGPSLTRPFHPESQKAYLTLLALHCERERASRVAWGPHTRDRRLGLGPISASSSSSRMMRDLAGNR